MSYQDELMKRDTEFFKAFAKDKTIKRTDFNTAHPIKHVQEPQGFKDVPRTLAIDAPTPEHKKIFTALSTYCAKFPNVTTPNLVLAGATGTGKTFTAQVIANILLDKGFNVHFTSALSMVESFQKYIQSYGRDEQAISPLLESDVLIIDDLGTEPIIKNITQEHIYSVIIVFSSVFSTTNHTNIHERRKAVA